MTTAAEIIAGRLNRAPTPAQDIYSEAERHGLDKHTMRHAAKKLGVKVKKVGFKGRWYWYLPDDAKLVSVEKPDEPKKRNFNCSHGRKRGPVLAAHNRKVIALLKSGQATTLEGCAAILGDCTGQALIQRNKKTGCFQRYLVNQPVQPVAKPGQSRKKMTFLRRLIFLFTGK